MRAIRLLGDWLRERVRARLVAQGMLAPHRALGARGEDLAHRFLQGEGLRIVGRNWKTRSASAEIDLIAWEGGELDGVLVFVEVKTRASDEINAPERQIDLVKRRNMAKGAAEYLRRFAPNQEQIRFDVVSVVDGTPPRLRHIRDAFRVEGFARRTPAQGEGARKPMTRAASAGR